VIKPHFPPSQQKKSDELEFPKFGFNYYCRQKAGDVDVRSVVVVIRPRPDVLIVPFVGPILRNPKSVCASTASTRMQFVPCRRF
jgi:hypothetical protein